MDLNNGIMKELELKELEQTKGGFAFLAGLLLGLFVGAIVGLIVLVVNNERTKKNSHFSEGPNRLWSCMSLNYFQIL